MKKLIITVILISTLTTAAYSQITLKGITLKNVASYNEGDTVIVYGRKVNPFANKEAYEYLIKDELGFKYVNINKIELLNSNLSFWEKVWFYNRGAEISKSGWEIFYRDSINKNAKDYFVYAKNNYMIYQDELLYDYIYQLIMEIHPTKLIKPKPTSFGLIIIKSDNPVYFSFDNGYIVLTTGLIALTKSEKALINILAQCISHIVLENTLLNFKKQIKNERTAEILGTVATVAAAGMMVYSNNKYDTNFNVGDVANVGWAASILSKSIVQSLGADYSFQQVENAIKTAKLYTDRLNDDERLSNEEYIKRISGVISFTAWQKYYMMDYLISLELINRIHNNNLATENDFLLLSKLYRATSNTKESNLEALKLIQQAKQIGLTYLTDLDKEAGIFYLRLNDHENAKASFLKYKKELYELEKQGVDISDELHYINQLLYKHKFLD